MLDNEIITGEENLKYFENCDNESNSLNDMKTHNEIIGYLENLKENANKPVNKHSTPTSYEDICPYQQEPCKTLLVKSKAFTKGEIFRRELIDALVTCYTDEELIRTKLLVGFKGFKNMKTEELMQEFTARVDKEELLALVARCYN